VPRQQTDGAWPRRTLVPPAFDGDTGMRTRPISCPRFPSRRQSRARGAMGTAALLAILQAGCGSEDTSVGPAGTDDGSRGDGIPSTGAVAPENRYFIDMRASAPAPITLDLDKAKALEVFGEDAARRIRILDVDSTVLLASVLDTIRDACGTRWKNDTKDPGYDCSLTPLGRSFGPAWRTSAEFALVRLLGMTSANAELTGTALATFATLVEQNRGTFTFDFADVLAQSLGIPRTEPFIPTSALVRSLQKNLLGTHPGIGNAGGRLPVSLYDALLDLSTLPEKFGPVADHPGVLVPDDVNFTTRSNVLLPDFRMRVVAASNLRRVQGIDLSSGAGDMFVKEGRAPLSFDFEDPEKLLIDGIAGTPTVDMRFAVTETKGFVPSCAGDVACRPYSLESIVTEAARLTYHDRAYHRCYLELGASCLVGVDIGGEGSRPGWAVFTNSIQGVSVPEPQTIWDLLASVAQVALHDPNGDGAPDIPEGGAAPVFALRGVPIGPSGAELVAEMRPMLQSQADTIAEVIAGRFWENNDDLDFYLVPAPEGGRPFLAFVASSDLRPDPDDPEAPKPYRYERPGFFSSPDLAEPSRLSSRVIAGVTESEHEKYEIEPGELVLYAEDDARDVYEIRLFVPEDEPLEMVVDIEKHGSRRSQ
jgi:hypothetical protein